MKLARSKAQRREPSPFLHRKNSPLARLLRRLEGLLPRRSSSRRTRVIRLTRTRALVLYEHGA